MNDASAVPVDAIHLILQSRMGSTRRPGKSMADICGKPFMERVLMRIERAFAGPKIAALPDCARDDVLEDLARARGWSVFRGSESDVLGRFAGAARAFGAKKFIRICGDNLLVDRRAVDGVVRSLATHKSCLTRGYPLGAHAEGAWCEALFEADERATDPHDREHVMPYIFRNADRFTFEHVEAPAFSSLPRLTSDTEEDLALMRDIFSRFGDDPALEEVISFVESRT